MTTIEFDPRHFVVDGIRYSRPQWFNNDAGVRAVREMFELIDDNRHEPSCLGCRPHEDGPGRSDLYSHNGYMHWRPGDPVARFEPGVSA